MSITHATVPVTAAAPTAALRRAALVLACAAAVAAGWAASDPVPMQAAAPDLARLLQGMAGLKALIAAGVTAAIFWRFGRSTSFGAAALYALGAATLWAGAACVWRLSHIAGVALLFHAALIALFVVALRDDAGPFRKRT